MKEDINDINEKRRYGKIDIKLNEQMKIKNVNVYRLSQSTNLSYNTIRSYKENQPISRIDLDVLARLCFTLDCKVEDLLEYKRD